MEQRANAKCDYTVNLDTYIYGVDDMGTTDTVTAYFYSFWGSYLGKTSKSEIGSSFWYEWDETFKYSSCDEQVAHFELEISGENALLIGEVSFRKDGP